MRSSYRNIAQYVYMRGGGGGGGGGFFLKVVEWQGVICPHVGNSVFDN